MGPWKLLQPLSHATPSCPSIIPNPCAFPSWSGWVYFWRILLTQLPLLKTPFSPLEAPFCSVHLVNTFLSVKICSIVPSPESFLTTQYIDGSFGCPSSNLHMRLSEHLTDLRTFVSFFVCLPSLHYEKRESGRKGGTGREEE